MVFQVFDLIGNVVNSIFALLMNQRLADALGGVNYAYILIGLFICGVLVRVFIARPTSFESPINDAVRIGKNSVKESKKND